MGKKKMVGKKMDMTSFLSDYSGRNALPSGPAQRDPDDDGRTYGRRAQRREEEVSRSEGDNNWRGGGRPESRYGKGGGFGGGGYGGYGDRDRDRYQAPSDSAPSWRRGLSSQDDERFSSGDRYGRNEPPSRAPPLGERKKLVLKQRTVPKDPAAAATASSIFGGAKPVQTKEVPMTEEERKKKEWEDKFKKSSEKMRAKYGEKASENNEKNVAKPSSTQAENASVTATTEDVANISLDDKTKETPKEPGVEAPKPPSPQEIAATKAEEVMASKKIGKDLVSWVNGQDGFLEKMRLPEMLDAVLKLDTAPDFSFKNIQPGQYGDLLKSISANKEQQVEAVFVAQDYCGTLGFPKDDKGSGLVYKLFIELYKHDLATDDALETWKDDYKRISDNKQKAILQTLKFFEWLLAEPESDSEEGDSEEDEQDEEDQHI